MCMRKELDHETLLRTLIKLQNYFPDDEVDLAKFKNKENNEGKSAHKICEELEPI